MKKDYFRKLQELVAELRSEHGCPWDKEQTLKSLIPSLREETEEVVHAIEAEDHENLKEELGDVLLNILLLTQIATEAKLFTLEGVLQEVSDKIIRRHPHVFADQHCEDSAEVLRRWAEIKRAETKKRKNQKT